METEVKLKVHPTNILTLLRASDVFFIETPRHLVVDALFDDKDSSLKRADIVVRLRATDNELDSVLTIKGPTSIEGGVKSREEAETPLDAHAEDVFVKLMGYLGLSVTFRSTKYRTYIQDHTAQKPEVFLDETPLGSFIEIEGTPERILELTKVLGFS